jgi:glucan-binding YG repeat protein/beta-lactamase superfamily II metal-dependent hydrolase
MVFSMIFLLNNSVFRTIAYAAEQNNTLSSNINSTTTVTTIDNDSAELNNEIIDNENLEFIDYDWKIIDNKKYYLVDNKILEMTGWFMEKDVNPNIGNKNNNTKYYLDKDFSVVVGWKKIDKYWYYFNADGIMQTGWIIGGSLYYLNDSGKMETGWNEIDGDSYYFDQYGQAAIGKRSIKDNWYFFDNQGILQKGFYNYNSKTYYSDDDGIMVTNKWVPTNRHKRYVKSDSSIAIGNLFLNGIMYNFNTNGFYQGTITNDENDLYIHYLDVGNADCAFIKLPSGETVLIDTGDTTTTNTLIDFLNNQNLKTDLFIPKINGQTTTTAASTIITSNSNNTVQSTTSNLNNGKGVIDYVILTHPHSDHIGGMIELMKNFNIGKVIIPKYFEMKGYSPGNTTVSEDNINIIKYDYNIYKATMDALLKNGQTLVQADPDSYIDSEHILQFLHSDTDYSKLEVDTYYEEYGSFNDNCAIVYLNYYDLQGLFTGDIQWNAENDFVNRKALKDNQVDILKVPHHGNIGSSSYTFIGYVQPTIGIITRAKEAINTTTEPYNVLTTCGVNLYELSATNGLSVYATKDNWNIEE